MNSENFKTIYKHYPENIRTEIFRSLLQQPVQGIPHILSIQETNNGWTVAEEFIQGQTLAEILKGGLIVKKRAVSICLELCKILKVLHARGIVHGDIKPENIIITPAGAVYLIDFDASHFVKEETGRDTVMMGTPGYASPEQFGFGRSDPRSDIYAMGVLLNVMLTGRHPLYEMANGRISIVVEKCTEVDPKKRYQSIKELEKGLKHPARRHEFFPVGFRSGNIGKMIVAILGYVAGIGFFIETTQPNHDWEVRTFTILRWSFIVLYIGTIFIFFNYAGINNIFSKKQNSRHIVAKIVEEIVFIIIVVLITLIIGVND